MEVTALLLIRLMDGVVMAAGANAEMVDAPKRAAATAMDDAYMVELGVVVFQSTCNKK